MVQFHPFRAYLPELSRGESIEDRVSPPYDVINEEERKELQSHPYNVTNITLGGVGGEYSAAGERLQQWIKSDVLARDGGNRSTCTNSSSWRGASYIPASVWLGCWPPRATILME